MSANHTTDTQSKRSDFLATTFEPLEGRLLLSRVTLTGHLLEVVGDLNSSNRIILSLSQNAHYIFLKINGATQSFHRGQIHTVEIFGGNYADYIVARSHHRQTIDCPETIVGGGGDDTLLGGNGEDVIFANGTGNSLLESGYANSTIVGGTGQDILIGGVGDNVLIAGTGNQLLEGGDGTGADVLLGGTGNDTLIGNTGHDYLLGYKGDNLINATGGQDTIYEGSGNDTVIGGGGQEIHDGIYAGFFKLLADVMPTIPGE